MDALYQQLIQNKQKAVIGFVVGAIIAYFAKYGIDLNTLTVADALRMLGAGIITYISVFVKKNQA